MVDAISLLLPNLTEIIVGGIIVLIGIGMLFLSGYVPLPRIRSLLFSGAWLTILGGIAYAFFVSFLKDVFSSFRSTVIAIAVIIVVLMALLMFSGINNNKKKRRRRK